MARNYEKNFGRLNRLWLEKGAVKRERRPKLSSLKTVNEISFWLPSIKKELDFFLKQTEVPCYTESKIDEYRKHIVHLEGEYKAFVRKFHQMNSHLKIATPWTTRPYEKKDTGNENILALHPVTACAQHVHIRPLQTPVLIHDQIYQDHCDKDEEENSNESHQHIYPRHNDSALFPSKEMERRIDTTSQPRESDDESTSENRREPSTVLPCVGENMFNKVQNVLGLDYSSSEDEDI